MGRAEIPKSLSLTYYVLSWVVFMVTKLTLFCCANVNTTASLFVIVQTENADFYPREVSASVYSQKRTERGVSNGKLKTKQADDLVEKREASPLNTEISVDC